MENAINQNQFKKFVLRSVTLPIVISVLLSASFVLLILHLMSLTQAVDRSNRLVAQAHEAFQLCVDSETGVRGYRLTSNEVFLEPYIRAERAMEEKFEELLKMTADNPQQHARIKNAQVRYDDWKKYGSTAVLLTRGKKDTEELQPSIIGKNLMDEVRAQFETFIRVEESLRDNRSQKTVQTVTTILFSILGVSLFAGIILALYTRRQLFSLSAIYSSALDKQAKQNQILQEQDWLQTGQGELARETRGDHSLENLGSNILSYLTSRLEAKVGAIYTLDRNILKRIAAYALDAETLSKNATIKMGEGLVGQAAKDISPFIMKSIPEDYMNVSSATGATKPESIYIYPVVASGQVKGVIELGFVGNVPDRTMEFLELTSESIAIGIKSAEYRAQLAELLEESQRLTEELQAQQEELRSSNEELEEQSNSLKQSQVKLESQQAELEQSNKQLMKQGRDLEDQAIAVNTKNHELVSAQVMLEHKAKELELSSKYKSQFMANMSHELRTPLNSTLILAQLLMENKRGRLGPEEIDFAKTILSSSNNLLTLINDILDLSKVEAGKIDLVPETISVKDMTNGLSNLFSPLANDKNIKLNVEIDHDLPSTIVTDWQRLEQILKNLLSNAIKFTVEGNVILKLSPSKNYPEKIDFAVTDSGIGISPDQQKVIFDAFKQADGTTSRKYGGTGLGLTISRDLAKLLGGEILVSSEVGKGSTFTLRLNKNFVPKDKKDEVITSFVMPTPSTEAIMTPPKIISKPLPFQDDRERLDDKFRLLLVIEDDTHFAKILYDLSREMSFNCIVAQKADEGIDAANEYLPHAIILDMHLPDHSGFTVLDRLKMNSRTRHIPVHIISALDQDPRSLQMGAIGHLKKPAAIEEIKTAIIKLEEKFGQNLKKVLVVEDDKVQRDSIRELIQDEAVKVTAVDSAASALSALRECVFDCMVLDLHLPDITGYDLLEKMTSENIPVRPPVIVYTGKDLSSSEEKKLQKYSQSIIIKGAHSPERLLSEVTLFLHQIENNLTSERQKMLQGLRDREKVFEDKKILLVDDDVRNIFAMSSALEGKGAQIEIARNGLEAVQKVKEDLSIDLVLMDIMMPEMDGLEAMREIKKDKRFEKLPIIAVTAKAMADDQEKCREAGANDYLAKPIELSKLLSLLRVWMPQRKRV